MCCASILTHFLCLCVGMETLSGFLLFIVLLCANMCNYTVHCVLFDAHHTPVCVCFFLTFDLSYSLQVKAGTISDHYTHCRIQRGNCYL